MRQDFTPIRNPFIVGNPLQPRDRGLFKGCRDIIAAIKENIINPAQRPALLLYGRRRLALLPNERRPRNQRPLRLLYV